MSNSTKGNDMRQFLLRLSCAMGAFVGFSGFGNDPKLPPDYSPGYHRMEIVAPNGKVRRILVPDACMSEEEPPMAQLGEPMLPSGCANAYNLEQMVERKEDLAEGRKLGPASPTTAARAAVKYLNGLEQNPSTASRTKD
jgi:hypothetical protein